MNDIRNMLVESLDKVLRDHCTPERVQAVDDGGFDPQLWAVVEELGFPLAGLDESRGGAGASIADLTTLLRLAGTHTAPAPLAETMMLGAWLLSAAGLAIPPGPLAVGPTLPQEQLLVSRKGGDWQLSGRLQRIAWPDRASRIVVLARLEDRYYVAAVDPAQCAVTRVLNLAGETRSTVQFDGVTLAGEEIAAAPPGLDYASLAARGALARAALLTGALDKALALALQYANERKQFGRPIAKFQAIQQQLAIFAAEVAAAKAMVDQAAMLADRGESANAIAAAKTRAGQAAGVGARVAHQVHGAMGFTQEYPLHHATRRLWAWRDENGSERYWSLQLGRNVAANGADHLWPMITGTR